MTDEEKIENIDTKVDTTLELIGARFSTIESALGTIEAKFRKISTGKMTLRIAIASACISGIACCFTGWNAYTSYYNSVAASEQILVSISPSLKDFSLAEQAAQRAMKNTKIERWDVVVSNSSLSAKANISAIEVGPFSYITTEGGNFLTTENGIRLIAVDNSLEDVPNFPIPLGPSDPLKFTMVTRTINGKNTLGSVTVHTTRGGSYTGSIKP